jgi:adenylate kinase family enzyme
MKFKPPPADVAKRVTQRSDDTEEKVPCCRPTRALLSHLVYETDLSLYLGVLLSRPPRSFHLQVKVRVAAYHHNLKALTDTYKNVLVRINGDRKPDVIYEDVSKAIKGK